MGYRSEWALVVRGPADKIATWRTRLVELTSAVDSSIRDVASTILQHERTARVDEGAALLFYGSGTKCYSPWDHVVLELISLARDELGIEAAYGRLGENDDDIEFRNDPDGLYIPFRRELVLDDMVGIEDAGPAWLDEEP